MDVSQMFFYNSNIPSRIVAQNLGHLQSPKMVPPFTPTTKKIPPAKTKPLFSVKNPINPTKKATMKIVKIDAVCFSFVPFHSFLDYLESQMIS